MERFSFDEKGAVLDCNVLNDATDYFDIRENKSLIVIVNGLTGTHAVHDVVVEIANSPEANFKIAPVIGTITGEGYIDNLSTCARYVRARVSKVEGAASTVSVTFQSK